MIDNLVRWFTEEEFKAFLKTMSTNSRSRTLALTLRKANTSANRDTIFMKVFQTNRNTQNDHLLRNELSILKKKAEIFIVNNNPVEAPYNADYYASYALSVWCVNKNLLNEAEVYLHNTVHIALKTNAWRGALLCTRLLGLVIQFSNISIEEKINKIKSLAEKHKYYLTQLVAREVQLINYINVSANKLASSNFSDSPNELKLLKDKVEFDINNPVDPLAQYYQLKSSAFLNSGIDAVNYMLESLDCLNQPVDFADIEEEKLISMANIALEYGMVADFEKAHEYYQKIISSPFFSSFRSKNGVLINNATTLVKLKRYSKAIENIEMINLKHIEPVVLPRVNTIRILAYIYTKDFIKLKKILPLKSETNEVPLKLYNKFLYVIYYLIQENVFDAQRELHNLMITKYGKESVYADLINLYNAYINCLIDNRAPNRTKLETELKCFNEKSQTKLYNTILSIWIREKSEQLVEQF